MNVDSAKELIPQFNNLELQSTNEDQDKPNTILLQSFQMGTQTITKENNSMLEKDDNRSDNSSPSQLIYQSYLNSTKHDVVKEINESSEFGACRSLTPIRNRQVGRQMQFKRTSAVEEPIQIKPYLF